jgi:hypothetical protein
MALQEEARIRAEKKEDRMALQEEVRIRAEEKEDRMALQEEARIRAEKKEDRMTLQEEVRIRAEEIEAWKKALHEDAKIRFEEEVARKMALREEARISAEEKRQPWKMALQEVVMTRPSVEDVRIRAGEEAVRIMTDDNEDTLPNAENEEQANRVRTEEEEVDMTRTIDVACQRAEETEKARIRTRKEEMNNMSLDKKGFSSEEEETTMMAEEKEVFPSVKNEEARMRARDAAWMNYESQRMKVKEEARSKASQKRAEKIVRQLEAKKKVGKTRFRHRNNRVKFPQILAKKKTFPKHEKEEQEEMSALDLLAWEQRTRVGYVECKARSMAEAEEVREEIHLLKQAFLDKKKSRKRAKQKQKQNLNLIAVEELAMLRPEEEWARLRAEEKWARLRAEEECASEEVHLLKQAFLGEKESSKRAKQKQKQKQKQKKNLVVVEKWARWKAEKWARLMAVEEWARLRAEEDEVQEKALCGVRVILRSRRATRRRADRSKTQREDSYD